MGVIKKEGNRRGKNKLLIDFSDEEKKEVVELVLECGDRSRAARIFGTTVTVVNLIFVGQHL